MSPLQEFLAEVVDESPPELEAVLKKLDPPDAKIVRRTVKSLSFSGPLPPPELLKQYAEIIPDGANRIVTMAENEQNLRSDVVRGALAIEDKVTNNDIVLSQRGQNYGFIGLLGLLVLSGTFAFIGLDVLAGGTVIASVATYAVQLIQARTLAKEAPQEESKKKR